MGSIRASKPGDRVVMRNVKIHDDTVADHCVNGDPQLGQGVHLFGELRVNGEDCRITDRGTVIVDGSRVLGRTVVDAAPIRNGWPHLWLERTETSGDPHIGIGHYTDSVISGSTLVANARVVKSKLTGRTFIPPTADHAVAVVRSSLRSVLLFQAWSQPFQGPAIVQDVDIADAVIIGGNIRSADDITSITSYNRGSRYTVTTKYRGYDKWFGTHAGFVGDYLVDLQVFTTTYPEASVYDLARIPRGRTVVEWTRIADVYRDGRPVHGTDREIHNMALLCDDYNRHQGNR